MMDSHTPRAVVDAHVHFWDLERLPYPWLAPDAPPRPFGGHRQIKRNYGPRDFEADLHGVNLEACVHVQANCADPRGETLWLADCARRTGRPTAHVAFANLCDPRVGEELEWLASQPLVRGVRLLLNWHPETVRRAAAQFDLMETAAFRAGFAKLRQHGFSFDLGCLPAQLPMACRLADEHPDTVLALNHLGWPLLSDADGEVVWRSGLRELARRPNVVLKVSGLWPIERRWSVQALRPLVRAAIEWFGFERSLYGSNFPIEKLMIPIPQQISNLLAILDDASEDELDGLFRTTARRVYRLP